MAAQKIARPETASPGNSDTKFFGSQIGGKSAINYSYTDMPWRLMAYDVYYFFKFLWAIPFIVWPLSPADSGELSELSFTSKNIYAVAVHVVLVILQLGFIVALPSLVTVPVWTAAAAIALFMLVNRTLASLLNGDRVEYMSDEKYAPALPEHAHEQWIYINGVAAGYVELSHLATELINSQRTREHWMKSNLNRLAVTFKRPILGIHNKTSGILFDVIECLIQRNLGYATTDVRVCYSIIKRKLYNPRYSKVIFILHSQGGIQGSLILDWLLQELPQDLLAKLEIYTFGNAANHFNNPHRHLHSQSLAKRNPLAASVDSTQPAPADQPRRDLAFNPISGTSPNSVPDKDLAKSSNSDGALPAIASSTTSSHPSALSDRAIGHIEHYAHTTDFVSLWGVLHFATSAPSSSTIPRFMGRVFARTSPRGGHQLVQHYLDGMFPLRKGPPYRGAGVPWGVEEEGNEFMESEVPLGGVGNCERDEDGDSDADGDGESGNGSGSEEVAVIGMGLVKEGKGLTREKERGEAVDVKAKVKELSRLWQYRNGRSPKEKPPLLARSEDGVVRNATM
ncbi:hypothetical protein MMYC01_203844 [Madurella mycetomatis]|uniref:Uncharacterized protein n=1 Tax=Madurella mycetomatis TaxID=100816 RepID=A0A175WCT3_9PEZI|nr:hypothetical protein MMYC01_203844 [Madurella mycetomatis]